MMYCWHTSVSKKYCVYFYMSDNNCDMEKLIRNSWY